MQMAMSRIELPKYHYQLYNLYYIETATAANGSLPLSVPERRELPLAVWLRCFSAARQSGHSPHHSTATLPISLVKCNGFLEAINRRRNNGGIV